MNNEKLKTLDQL